MGFSSPITINILKVEIGPEIQHYPNFLILLLCRAQKERERNAFFLFNSYPSALFFFSLALPYYLLSLSHIPYHHQPYLIHHQPYPYLLLVSNFPYSSFHLSSFLLSPPHLPTQKHEIAITSPCPLTPPPPPRPSIARSQLPPMVEAHCTINCVTTLLVGHCQW